MAGYTRQDTTGQLANGNPIDADIFNDEYDAIESAFNASSGHTHDGSVGGGAPIESIGPSQELEVTSSSVFPKNDNLIDLGKPTLRWRNGYFGTDVQVGNDLTVTGDTTLNGNTAIGDSATDTVTVNADISSNLTPDATGVRNIGSATDEWNDIFIDGTATIDTLTVDEDGTVAGNFDVTGNVGIDGNFDIATTMFTIDSTNGNTVIAGTLDVAGATNITSTISATSTTTGALVTSGGVGIAENLHVGGTLDVTGDTTLTNVDATTLDVSGAVGIDGNFDIGTDKFTVDATTGNTAVAGTLDVTGDMTVENLTVNGNTVLGDADTDTVTITADVASNIIPDTDSTYTLGNATDYWSHGYIDAITTTGDVGVGGNVTITGDLTVSGTTTTVNSTTVEIADLNIEVASNAATAAAANGGGLTVGGANATFTYDSVTDRWDMNKDLEVTNVYANLTGDVTGDVTGDLTGNVTGNVTGNLDGIVGGTTPAAGTFTTLEFSTSITDGTTTIDGFIDEDDMTSDSATKVPTQQSVKAYVDAAVQGDASATFSASTVDAVAFDLNGGDGSGWVIYQSGTDLKFKYNGVDRFKLTSAGAMTVEDDVTAYGAA